jgi:hypothetical protein
MTEPHQRSFESGPHFQLYRASAATAVRWRLLGGNNRPLARSALDYVDEGECRNALTELNKTLSELVGRVDRQPPNLWVWRLSDVEGDVAVSAHPYDRQIRSQHAMAQFLQNAARARIDKTVVMSAARRWRSISAPAGSRNETVR